jgi:parallel beta-helix repeat protein
LLVGREDLESGEIENNEIEDNEIRDSEDGIEIADCEEFFLNHTDRCAVSLHSTNFLINKTTIETANTY